MFVIIFFYFRFMAAVSCVLPVPNEAGVTLIYVDVCFGVNVETNEDSS